MPGYCCERNHSCQVWNTCISTQLFSLLLCIKLFVFSPVSLTRQLSAITWQLPTRERKGVTCFLQGYKFLFRQCQGCVTQFKESTCFCACELTDTYDWPEERGLSLATGSMPPLLISFFFFFAHMVSWPQFGCGIIGIKNSNGRGGTFLVAPLLHPPLKIHEKYFYVFQLSFKPALRLCAPSNYLHHLIRYKEHITLSVTKFLLGSCHKVWLLCIQYTVQVMSNDQGEFSIGVPCPCML